MARATGVLLLLTAATLLVGVSTGAQTDLTEHVLWAIAHEGCAAFSGNDLKSLSQLRSCFIEKEPRNPDAANLIRNATPAQLQSAVQDALSLAYTRYRIPENFEWVLSHEKQLEFFRELGRSRDYDRIRITYYHFQDHNPNARNVLNAVSDGQIQSFLNAPRLTVVISRETDYEGLKKLDSLVLPKTTRVQSGTTLASLMNDIYGFATSGLARLIVEKNKQLSQIPETSDPTAFGIPAGTDVILPSIPRAGELGTVPVRPSSGTSCPTCFTFNAEFVTTQTLLQSQGTMIEPEVFGHIEVPAGQLQSVNLPTAGDYGWYLKFLGLNSIEPSDLTLIAPVPIGIVDSGADTGDADLIPYFWSTPPAVSDPRWPAGAAGYDFLRRTSDPYDEMSSSHGTHVSGLAVGEQVSTWIPAFSQILVHRARLAELKIAGKEGKFDSANAQNAIIAGVGKGIRIFNLSFELATDSDMLNVYLADRRANALFVVAAGNYGAISQGSNLDDDTFTHSTFRGVDSLPLSDVIFVAALGKDGKIAGFSNYGKQTVEIAAPGESVSSTIRNGAHGLLSGTSQAAPFVTLTAAILLSELPAFSLPEVHQRIVDTCDWQPELKDYVRDGCRLNIQKAITSNVDLIQLRSGVVLKGTVSSTQFPIPGSGAPQQNPKYERVWFDDTGQFTIVTTGGRYTIRAAALPVVKIELKTSSDCPGQLNGTSCSVPVSAIKDVVFRASSI